MPAETKQPKAKDKVKTKSHGSGVVVLVDASEHCGKYHNVYHVKMDADEKVRHFVAAELS